MVVLFDEKYQFIMGRVLIFLLMLAGACNGEKSKFELDIKQNRKLQ